MKLPKCSLVIFVYFIAAPREIDTGRPVQEDPRGSKSYYLNGPLVQDAPDELPDPKQSLASNQESHFILPTTHPKPVQQGTPRYNRTRKVHHNRPLPITEKNKLPPDHKLRDQKEHADENVTLPSIIILYNQEEGDDKKLKARQAGINNNVLTTYRHMYSSVWYQATLIPTEKVPYGGCLLGLGYSNNPTCLLGEVCVDAITGQRVTSCSTPANPCNCPSGPAPCPAPCKPPQECGIGCPPNAACALPKPDGVCIDSTFPTNDYIDLTSSTEKDRTPMVYYAGTLQRNDTCIAYGDAIDTFERGFEEFNEKVRKLQTNAGAQQFGSEICNYQAARLECLPDVRREATTTSGQPPIQSDLDAYLRPKGTCQCMLALGQHPVVVKNEIDQEICYIPANLGHHSDCDHEIFLPYGGIDGVRRDGSPLVKMVFEPAEKFCVPNAECRAGYRYTGLRCQCKKKTKWDPVTSTCSWGYKPTIDGFITAVSLLAIALLSDQ